MKGQFEVIKLLEQGGLIFRDFLIGCDTFRIINGQKVKIKQAPEVVPPQNLQGDREEPRLRSGSAKQ